MSLYIISIMHKIILKVLKTFKHILYQFCGTAALLRPLWVGHCNSVGGGGGKMTHTAGRFLTWRRRLNAMFHR